MEQNRFTILIFVSFGQFFVLAKSKPTTTKTVHNSHAVKAVSAMTPQQAALIVTMRAAVDKRLDTLGHTCEYFSCENQENIVPELIKFHLGKMKESSHELSSFRIRVTNLQFFCRLRWRVWRRMNSAPQSSTEDVSAKKGRDGSHWNRICRDIHSGLLRPCYITSNFV